MTFSEFLHMGGYAFYVWTAYGIACLVLVLNLILPVQQHRQILQRIARQLRRTGQDS